MADIEILDLERHSTPEGVPFVVAVVDSVADGDIKFVVLFQEPGTCAVLSMDRVIEEDLSPRSHSQVGSSNLEKSLREMIGEIW